MSLTARWRVPHPVRPKTNYDSKVLWSWICPEISSYQSVKIGRMGRGYHLLGWTLNIWNCNGWNRFNKTWKNRHGSVQGKCCQKIRGFSCLTLFWYSPTHQRFRQNCDTIIARSANPILEKLCFRVINPSEVTRNWNDRPLGLPEEISFIRTLRKYKWLQHPRRYPSGYDYVTEPNY